MRPFTSTISIDEALRRARAAVVAVERTERVSLREAAGRVAAEDVTARADVPPFDRAAMDGYAVVAIDTREATTTSPRSLRRTGVTFAGHAPHAGIAAGECVEIATGAPLPPGADAVVMVERTTREGGRVLVREPARPGQHVGRRANDLAAGDAVVSRGDWLSPARVGALAAAGVPDVLVFARPLVALASTGDELVLPGQPLGEGRIHDVNRFTLPAVIGAHGADTRLLPTVGDSAGAVHAALDAAGGADLVVFTGGSSVGDRDLVALVVAERGDILFHGVSMKPGKPTMLARLRRGRSRAAVPRAVGQPDVVPGQRLHPAGADAAGDSAPAGVAPAARERAARPRHQGAGRPPPVLPRAARARGGGGGLQGLWRDHESLARGRLHRDPGRDGGRRRRHAGQRDAVPLTGCEARGIWGPGDLGTWGSGDLGFWGPGVLGRDSRP